MGKKPAPKPKWDEVKFRSIFDSMEPPAIARVLKKFQQALDDEGGAKGTATINSTFSGPNHKITEQDFDHARRGANPHAGAQRTIETRRAKAEELAQRIREGHKAGRTNKQIAHDVGVSAARVGQVLRNKK